MITHKSHGPWLASVQRVISPGLLTTSIAPLSGIGKEWGDLGKGGMGRIGEDCGGLGKDSACHCTLPKVMAISSAVIVANGLRGKGHEVLESAGSVSNHVSS